jgi:hypothetical protein
LKDLTMMMNNTLAQLRELKLVGMATAVEEQLSSTASTTLSFEERLALMVDREVHQRADKRHAALLKRARLKYPQACIEDVDGRTGRGFERPGIDEPGAVTLGRGRHGNPHHRAHRFGQVGWAATGVIVSFQQIDTVAAGQAVASPMRRLGM